MAQSSDELVKREIIDFIGTEINGFTLRAFPESSREDQKLFDDGGLTFSFNGIDYGSCDLAFIDENFKAFIAIEGTDALNRGSSGNAQYQRFHHALGAVKNGLIGIYYLRPGTLEIRPDLYAMAYHATIKENGHYVITQDLNEIKNILLFGKNPKELENYLNNLIDKNYAIFKKYFVETYDNDLLEFARKRSTIIFDNDEFIIKYSARNKLNFTDGSQRAGHIALGEMYLTKYFFPDYKFYYLWPRMTKDELVDLNETKKNDKEWSLISSEPNVTIVTITDLKGVPNDLINDFLEISKKPLKGEHMKKYNKSVKDLRQLIEDKKVTIKHSLS